MGKSGIWKTNHVPGTTCSGCGRTWKVINDSKESEGILDRIRCRYSKVRYSSTMIPRRRDQDARYYGHKELLESLLGKPTEETDECVKYQRDGGYIICRQFLSGPKMYSGGYIEMFFNH